MCEKPEHLIIVIMVLFHQLFYIVACGYFVSDTEKGKGVHSRKQQHFFHDRVYPVSSLFSSAPLTCRVKSSFCCLAGEPWQSLSSPSVGDVFSSSLSVLCCPFNCFDVEIFENVLLLAHIWQRTTISFALNRINSKYSLYLQLTVFFFRSTSTVVLLLMSQINGCIIHLQLHCFLMFF